MSKLHLRSPRPRVPGFVSGLAEPAMCRPTPSTELGGSLPAVLFRKPNVTAPTQYVNRLAVIVTKTQNSDVFHQNSITVHILMVTSSRIESPPFMEIIRMIQLSRLWWRKSVSLAIQNQFPIRHHIPKDICGLCRYNIK